MYCHLCTDRELIGAIEEKKLEDYTTLCTFEFTLYNLKKNIGAEITARFAAISRMINNLEVIIIESLFYSFMLLGYAKKCS